MKKVSVTATGVGFDGYLLRKPGDIFEVREDLAKKYSSWFKPTNPDFKVARRVEPRTPATVNDDVAALKLQVAQLTALLNQRVTADVADVEDVEDVGVAGQSLV